MAQPGPSFGSVGALRAFPQRLAARAVAARGGRLRRGTTRQTARVVIGRKLLDKLSDTAIEAKVEGYRTAYRTLTGVDLGASPNPVIEQQV